MARYGHQDIHKLRGVERLTEFEKWMFAEVLLEHIESEVQPLEKPPGASED